MTINVLLMNTFTAIYYSLRKFVFDNNLSQGIIKLVQY